MSYNDFIQKKLKISHYHGFEVDKKDIHKTLFNYQKDLTLWALKKGKACLFTGTGTGKTFMELEFARQVNLKTGKKSIIVAPLAVSEQIRKEAHDKMGLDIYNIRRNTGNYKSDIHIINYESISKIDPADYIDCIFDESSILKNLDGKRRNELIEMFIDYSYKLCCSATPSPNDFMELGNHCQHLNVMSYNEMLAMYFTHDGSDTTKWRLKKQGIKRFWEFLSTWAAFMNEPSDLGYDFNFNLPELHIDIIKVKEEYKNENKFFLVDVDVSKMSLNDRRKARKNSLSAKVEWIKNYIDNHKDNIFCIWCDLNKESEELHKNINESIEVKGSDKLEIKEKNLLAFSEGKIKELITKPKIAGHGMNWQICHNVFFCGLSDSFEQFFQAIRRFWRYGQLHNVNVFIVVCDSENITIENIQRKERDHNKMYSEMVLHTKKYIIDDIRGNKDHASSYKPNINMIIPEWLRSYTDVS